MLEGSFMNNNKQILNYCKNYYKIIDFNFNEEDFITEKLIKIYKKFIFNVDINNTNEVNKVVELDYLIWWMGKKNKDRKSIAHHTITIFY